MAAFGLTASSSRCLRAPGPGSLNRRASAFPSARKPKEQIGFLPVERYCLIVGQLFKLWVRAVYIIIRLSWVWHVVIYRTYWTGSVRRCGTQQSHLIKCAMDASYGDMSNEPPGNLLFSWLVDDCLLFVHGDLYLVEKILLQGMVL